MPAAAGDYGTQALENPAAAPGEAGAESAAPAPKRRSRKVLWIVLAVVIVIVAALVALSAFVWPGWGTKTLSQDALQKGVHQVLTDKNSASGYGLDDVKDVSCPSGKKVRKGETFTCSVSVGGQNKLVTVRVTDNDGTYEVSKPAN